MTGPAEFSTFVASLAAASGRTSLIGISERYLEQCFDAPVVRTLTQPPACPNVDVPGFGPTPGTLLPVGDDGTTLVIARCPNPLDRDELRHARTVADILSLALRPSTDSSAGQDGLIGTEEFTAELQRALEANEFVVFYQPIVDLRTRRFIGAEALVRWDHPERGIVGPGAFIEAAELSGMIVPIGQRVLQLACEQTSKWRRHLPGADDLRISVNLSMRQLQHDDVETHVADALSTSGLEPSALSLEVTESVFADDAEEAGERLRSLKRHGMKLAIDDFGTGYSSLSYVHHYPFDVLKIDRAFVKGLGTPDNDGAVVRTMLTLASQLKMTPVAEGIETPGELAQLRALRCELAQGFHFAHPANADCFEDIFTQRAQQLHPTPATV